MLSGDLLGVTNGAQTKTTGPASNCREICEKKREQERVSLSVWFYSSLSSASIRPLPYARASYYISLTFAFAGALIERIQYSGKDLPTVPTWPWLPVPDNFSKQDTSVEARPCERAVSSLGIHDGQPAPSNLQRRVWVTTTWINFCLSKQLLRQEEADAERRRVAPWDWNLRMVQKFVSPPRWHPYPSHLLSGWW